MSAVPLFVAAALALACSACTRGPAGPVPAAGSPAGTVATTAATASGAVDAALPPGALVELVPVPAELPEGLSPLPDGAGPLDVRAVAELDGDPAATLKTLQRTGFRDGYSAAYTDADTGAFVSVVVLRFETGQGSRDAFAQQMGPLRASREPLALVSIGDESAAWREQATDGDVAQTVTVRFRVRELTWWVSAGGFAAADLGVASDVAARLARRTS